ncbi:MAG: hypothetical protein PHO02_03330 [Candidatus Nanoarchaeia archaeon]|nr:hypothetical protein [Candidatus Nanoarchaeia archaeon]
MNKTIVLVMLFALAFAGAVSAIGDAACSPSVTLLNQDPYPGMPDSYVKLVFMVTGVAGSNCDKGVWIKLIPTYPFSLDGDESLKTLESNTFISNQNSNWMVPYKLRVDKDALEGEYDIEAHYGANGISSPTGSYHIEFFNVTLEDSRTSFDALIQEVSGTEVTIALANTGKNIANSVVVRIPEQENFRVTGTDGQMVGNLESGDYTVVGFSISQAMQTGRQNRTGDFQQMPFENLKAPAESAKELKFDIYYTDSLGVRRVINTALPLNMNGAINMTGFGNLGARRTTQAQSAFSLSSLFTWQAGAALLIGLIAAFFFAKKRYAGKKAHVSPSEVPDWAKERKK